MWKKLEMAAIVRTDRDSIDPLLKCGSRNLRGGHIESQIDDFNRHYPGQQCSVQGQH
jgi:hypothetical protein